MLEIASPYLKVSRRISAPSGEVWRILTDTQLWPYWGPSVRKAECTERYVKAGSTGRVQLFSATWVKFVVTDFEEGRYWSWRVLGIRATGHWVEPLSDTYCRAGFEIPMLAAPYAVVCWVALKRISKLAGYPST